MRRHPYFDLLLHDDEELAAVLGCDVSERVTLHEWPLSCVQRLVMADGRKLIYKAQSGPTVEPEFYARAYSPLLLRAQTILRESGYACTLLEYVEGPRASDLVMSEPDVVERGCALHREIAGIAGDLPCYLDISSPERWALAMTKVVANLRDLVAAGRFREVDEDAVRRVEGWAFSVPVVAATATQAYLHGDLAGDNVFVLPSGYRVVDWQRPFRGPADLDLATWLESFGLDPLRHLAEGVVWTLYLLRLAWFTECAVRWFPEGIPDYDGQIARLAMMLGRETGEA